MSNFDYLPQECIAQILSLTTPRDLCRSSAVSHSFVAAADSDSAWEKFLPAEYDRLRSAPPPQPRKKDAYFDICDNPLLLEGGDMSLWLERCSGKKCYMIGSRRVGVIWGDAPEYWIWSSQHASRFSEVAELRRVCWLETGGTMDTRLLSPNTMYGAYFVFKFNEVNDGFEDLPLDVYLVFGPEVGTRSIFLDPDGKLMEHYEQQQQEHHDQDTTAHRHERQQLPWKREDGWMEIELGEFFLGSDESGDVVVKLKQVKRLNWKSGLVIQGFEFRPRQTV